MLHLSAGGCCEGFLPKLISKVSGLTALQGVYLFGNPSRQQGNLGSSGSTALLSRYFGSEHHGSHDLDCQGQLWMFLLDSTMPSHLPAAAQDCFYNVCLDRAPGHWELIWDNFLKEGAYESKPTHADALSQKTMILILDSHPERPSQSVAWVLNPFCEFQFFLPFQVHWAFQALPCARALIDGNHLSSCPFSGVLGTGNVRAQTSILICHCLSASSHCHGIALT